MANLIVGGYDDSTGQNKRASSGDSLVDDSGNPISVGSATTLLGSATSIDLTSSGNTELYTVPSGRRAIITDAFVHITALSGLTTHGAYTIQNTAGTETYLATQTPPGNLNAVDMVWSFIRTIAVAYADSAGSGVAIQFNSAGATATTLTASVYLFGVLI